MAFPRGSGGDNRCVLMEEEEGHGYFLKNSPVSGESKPPVIVESKKKRSFSGMRDPDAEVIALSPKALMATNRFVCEICNKGFQRDQNLQLHRRGHNLPWKLRQRTTKDVRKRVYICPETSCVHHDPARALGDLTGIKKHFCRKHGEKKHRCDRCSKKYAVLSDLKAHVKTCGTREYRCDCGTLFSRRDSFITHRAFCDALVQETARSQPVAGPAGDLNVQVMGPPLPPIASSSPPSATCCSPSLPPTPSTDVFSPAISVHTSALIASSVAAATVPGSGDSFSGGGAAISASEQLSHQSFHPPPSTYSSLLRPIRPTGDSVSLTLSPSFYGGLAAFPQNPRPPSYAPVSPPSPVLSATALLQKAAQMGTTTSSNPSVLQVLGIPTPPPLVISTMAAAAATQWSKLDDNINTHAHSTFPSSFPDSILKPETNTATLDFLGLGVRGGGFLNSISVPTADDAFAAMCSGIGAWVDDDTSEQKPIL